jgi:hypothetical protein
MRKPFALLVVVLLAAAVAGSASAAARTIATATTTDYRVVLTASKGKPSGGAPSATVRIRLYERAGKGWRAFANRRVPGTYFWNTVTAGHAVCRLEMRTAGEAPGFRSVAVVQLLVTPAIGCGRARSFPLVRAP